MHEKQTFVKSSIALDILDWVLNGLHLSLERRGNVWMQLAVKYSGWVCEKNKKTKLLHKLRKATKTCPRIVCVCGFFAAHVYECRCHLFVFRTTAAVNFAALCFVWSLLPLHSANVVFLLSVTLKPLWSTVYSHSFGTLCPSSAAATQWLNKRRFSLNVHSALVIIWFVAVLKQLFTWAEQFGKCLSQWGK